MTTTNSQEQITSTPQTIKITQSLSEHTRSNCNSFDECIQFLIRKGKQLYGEHFMIYPEDYEVFYKLLCIIYKQPNRARKYSLDVNKGIMLTGPIGCGKTAIMHLLRYLLPEAERYPVVSSREISFQFIQNGYQVIQQYSTQNFTQKWKARTVCFDDLGSEQNLKYYGNECNVLGEILLSRYDLFYNARMITHITTNLSATELEEAYGNRVRSRMREMFNLIAFDKDARDKRT